MPTKATVVTSTVVTPAAAPLLTGRHRPSSLNDFKLYAENLAWLLTGLSHQKAQDLLARIYSYANQHELRVAMSEPGKPGPFENEAEPGKFIPGLATPRFTPHVRRITTLVWDTVRAENLDIPNRRVTLCSMLGLFASPAVHRQCVKQVEALLELAERQGLPTSIMASLRGYQCPCTFDGKALASLDAVGLGVLEPGSPRVVPQDMLDELRQFHVARSVVAMTPPRATHPWLAAQPAIGSPSPVEPGERHRILDPEFTKACAWRGAYEMTDATFMDEVDSLRNAVTGEPWNPALLPPEFGWDATVQFLETQNLALVDSSKILGNAENAQGFASEWMAQMRRQRAQAWLAHAENTQAVLRFNQVPPAEGNWGEGVDLLDIFVHLSPARSASPEDNGYMTLWDFRATVGSVNTRKRILTPLAVMSGVFIVPFRSGGEYEVSPAEFERMLRKHSSLLDHLSYMLEEHFFERPGRDVERWLSEDEEPREPINVHKFAHARSTQGILVPRLEFSQQELNANARVTLLKMLVCALEECPATNWPTSLAPEDEEIYGARAVYEDLCLAAPGMLVLEEGWPDIAAVKNEISNVDVFVYSPEAGVENYAITLV